MLKAGRMRASKTTIGSKKRAGNITPVARKSVGPKRTDRKTSDGARKNLRTRTTNPRKRVIARKTVPTAPETERLTAHVALLKREVNSLDRRADGLEEKLLQEIGVLRKRADDVEEGLLTLTNVLLNELPARLADTDSRIQTLNEAYDNLFTIMDRLVPDDNPISRSIKGGLGVLVDRGGATPIDGNAARIGGGKVVVKE